jgi:hypothetical protein
MLLGTILEGFVVRGTWDTAAALVNKITGRQIEIISPRPDEHLQSPEPLGQGLSYLVTGKLKHLPKNHEIWLLVEQLVTRCVWPQGFSRVVFDPARKSWSGRINPSVSGARRGPVKIIAVVAPPTSQDLFNYFRQLGTMLHHDFVPLSRVPPECQNTAFVQARVP